MITVIRETHPENNLQVAQYYISKYVSTELQAFIIDLANHEVSKPIFDQDSIMQVSRYQLCHNIAKSLCCLHDDDHYNAIGIYDKLIDPPKPADMSATQYYQSMMMNNIPDPDEMFWLSIEKLKILFKYLEQIMEDDNLTALKSNMLTVSRKRDTIDVTNIHNSLSEVHFISGHMRTEDPIKVDFANKRIGGGVLKHGCCQEEIMFLSNPDLIGLMPFVPTMNEDEAVVVSGVKQQFVISGYGYDLHLQGGCDINLSQTIIMVDAIDYRKREAEQYQSRNKMLELNKLLLGFSSIEGPTCISTGQWGCGVFGGDSRLKFLMQWLAASIAGHTLKFYTKPDLDLFQLYTYNRFYDTNKLLQMIQDHQDLFGSYTIRQL